jgi:hypothetical protein
MDMSLSNREICNNRRILDTNTRTTEVKGSPK